MLDFIAWWISVEVLGFVILPMAFLLFSRLPDRGYAFAKPLGLVLAGYLFWLVGSTGILPANRWTILLIVALLTVASSLLWRKHRQPLLEFLRRERWTILTVEVLFLVAFVGWAIVRSYDPAIDHTEQPMDFAFLNASIRADSFPPQDPWLSGNSISYYYFGYLINGSLSKVTGVSGGVSYNLAVSLLFALTAIGAFGLVQNLVRMHRGDRRTGLGVPVGFGLLGAILVVGIGNLEGVLESVRSLGFGSEGLWDWIGVKGLAGTADGRSLYPSDPWWWWRSSRVIDTLRDGQSLDFTITETPSFSFVLGDLHPHVMSLPFVLLGLALGLQVLRSKEAFGPAWLRRHPVAFVVIALCLGALGFLNAWDLPTLVAVFLILTLIQSYRVWGRWDWPLFQGWVAFAIALATLSLLLFLPFYLGLKTQVSGVLPVDDVETRYIHYVLVLGLFLFFTLSFLLFTMWRLWRKKKLFWTEAGISVLLALAPFVLWAIVVLLVDLVKGDAGDIPGDIGGRFLRLLPLHTILAVVLLAILRNVRARHLPDSPRHSSILFVLLLILFGFLLTLGPELFRIVDVFGNRMNTVFKFYYQSWILLAIASAFAVYYIGTSWRWRGVWRRVVGSSWAGVAVVLVIGSLLFPFGAVYDKTNSFGSDPTLDGLAFVGNKGEAEREALEFLMKDATENSVLVEAIGLNAEGKPAGDYYLGYNLESQVLNLEYGRVSSRTGLPTILGWAGHEYQWRGSRRSFQERVRDVIEIYTGSDIDATKELLRKYDVSYVYIGRIEKALYGIQDTSKFDTFMDRVVDSDNVTIFKVRKGFEDDVARQ